MEAKSPPCWPHFTIIAEERYAAFVFPNHGAHTASLLIGSNEKSDDSDRSKRKDVRKNSRHDLIPVFEWRAAAKQNRSCAENWVLNWVLFLLSLRLDSAQTVYETLMEPRGTAERVLCDPKFV